MEDSIAALVRAFRCLPGIGPRSAQRLVFHLLQQNSRQLGLNLASCLHEAMHQVQNCKRCNNFTIYEFCHFCQDNSRDANLLCVVESPAGIMAIEQSNYYRGSYYLLTGLISPLDGLGPQEIGLPRLRTLVQKEGIKEIILALSPTVEGQTTAHFIHELLDGLGAYISQLAQGVPAGGELEFLDGMTIRNALRNRGKLFARTD